MLASPACAEWPRSAGPACTGTSPAAQPATRGAGCAASRSGRHSRSRRRRCKQQRKRQRCRRCEQQRQQRRHGRPACGRDCGRCGCRYRGRCGCSRTNDTTPIATGQGGQSRWDRPGCTQHSGPARSRQPGQAQGEEPADMPGPELTAVACLHARAGPLLLHLISNSAWMLHGLPRCPSCCPAPSRAQQAQPERRRSIQLEATALQ